jgi:hypothetical protein
MSLYRFVMDNIVHHCGEKVTGAVIFTTVILHAHAKLFPSPEKFKKY